MLDIDLPLSQIFISVTELVLMDEEALYSSSSDWVPVLAKPWYPYRVFL